MWAWHADGVATLHVHGRETLVFVMSLYPSSILSIFQPRIPSAPQIGHATCMFEVVWSLQTPLRPPYTISFSMNRLQPASHYFDDPEEISKANAKGPLEAVETNLALLNPVLLSAWRYPPKTLLGR